jgi:hypothetical protein
LPNWIVQNENESLRQKAKKNQVVEIILIFTFDEVVNPLIFDQLFMVFDEVINPIPVPNEDGFGFSSSA